MKAAALVVQAVDGRVHAIGSSSLVELDELATLARATGMLRVAGKDIAVERGALLASWRGPAIFRCAVQKPADKPAEGPKVKRAK